MPRWQEVLNSFNAGELSPRMLGRTDLAKYSAGAREITNFIVQPQGGAYRRPGSRYVAEVKNAADNTRLVPFVYSITQAYVLEFGDQYMRAFRNEAPVLSGPSPFELATPYTEDEVFDLRFAQSADVLYVVHKDHAPRKITRTSDTAWTIEVIDFVDGPYLPKNTTDTTLSSSAIGPGAATLTASSTTGINGGAGFVAGDVGRHVRLADPIATDPPFWGWAKITAINSTTSVDIDIKGAFTVFGTASTRWHLGAWYTGNYPRVVTLSQGRLVMCGEPNTPQTLHASMSTFKEYFLPTGDFVKYPTEEDVFDDNALDFEIGTGQVNDIRYAEDQTGLVLGTANGQFPVQASSRQEAVTPTNINIPESTRAGAARVDAIKVRDVILYAGRDKRHIFSLAFSFDTDTLAAEDLTRLADHILGDGVVELDYSEENSRLVLAATEGGRLCHMCYVPEEEVFAWSKSEIGGSLGGGIAQVRSIAVIPDSTESHDQIWMIVERTINGSTVKYVEFLDEPFRQVDPDQAIETAFFVDSGLSLDGAAASDPATITAATQGNPVNITTSVAHNYINGDHVRIRGMVGMTELNGNAYAVANATATTFDLTTFAGTNIDGTGFGAYVSGGNSRKMTTAISGLGHLIGETVDILADGSPQPSKVVNGSGAITLDQEAAEVQVGLRYNSNLRSLPIVPVTRSGSMEARLSRIDKVFLQLLDSVGGSVGPDADNLDDLVYRESSDPMTGALQPVTERVEVTFEQSYDIGIEVYVRQSQPLPMSVISMVVRGSSGDL